METFSDPENDFGTTAKSSVKLIKNSKGVNIEVKVVNGEQENMESLKEIAWKIYIDLEKKLKEYGK